MGLPRFKSKRRAGLSCRFTTGAIRVEADRHHVTLPGMVRNHRLARSIADAGFGEIRRQLASKTTWKGGLLQVADRWYPSSKDRARRGR